jgi:hypothetical protein
VSHKSGEYGIPRVRVTFENKASSEKTVYNKLGGV